MTAQAASGRYPLDLLERAQQGEEESLLALLDLAQPDIHRYARSTCLASDVDDAVQESLWLLYRKVGGVRTIAALSGWLFTVVKRECLRLARVGRSASESGIDAIEDDLRFSRMPQDELRMDLVRALRELPDHYREIVLSVDVQEIPVGDAATLLGLTRESAKARLHRARIQLRHTLLRD